MANKGLAWLGGAGLGAGLMYMLDPERGRRRRARVRDKGVSLLTHVNCAIDATARDLRQRTSGLIAEMRSKLAPEGVVDDAVLEARVRSELGRTVSHPHAIRVTADQGRVTLSGPVLAREVDDLLSCVSSVRGVTEVENRLEVHQQADNVPALQGGAGRRLGPQLDVMQTNWSPATRFLLGTAGGALAAYGAKRRDALGLTLSGLGFAILARGLTNIEAKRLFGLGGGRRAVDIQKTITVSAPVESVYEFWSHYENFPHFMSNVLEVRDIGGGRSHWVVAGPAGTTVEWNAEETARVSNQILAWKSEPDAAVQHAGIIRFEPAAEGGTRLTIRLSYNPPAGAVGHAVATLLGADPKTQMDEDLARMKTFIETGKPPHDAAARRAREAHAS